MALQERAAAIRRGEVRKLGGRHSHSTHYLARSEEERKAQTEKKAEAAATTTAMPGSLRTNGRNRQTERQGGREREELTGRRRRRRWRWRWR
jgi:hypothetical protein